MTRRTEHNFTTKRLACSLVTEDDIEVKELYQTESRMKHLGGALSENDANQVLNRMVCWNNHVVSNAFWKVTNRISGDFIGVQGITKVSTFENVSEIGILLSKQAEGFGYASEALEIMCDYVAANLKIQYLLIIYAQQNVRMKKSVENLGFSIPHIFIKNEEPFQLHIRSGCT